MNNGKTPQVYDEAISLNTVCVSERVYEEPSHKRKTVFLKTT